MTNQGSIVLFKSELDVLNLFSEELKKGFISVGYEIYEFDLNDCVKSLGLLYEYIAEKRVVAMVGFNLSVFGLKTPSGINVWETLGIRCINILVDHPYWYHEIISNMPGDGIILSIDRNHMKYVSRYYPEIPICGFLPHGGTISDEVSKNGLKEIKDRSIDVLYAGSLNADYGNIKRPDFSNLTFDGDKIYDKALEYLLKNTSQTVEYAVEKVLDQENIVLDEEAKRVFISSCRSLESILGTHFRVGLLEGIAKAGIKLTIYGSNWEKCEWVNLPNVSYGGRISPKEVLNKMADSKIVLNSMPWFKDGSHERIFNGMLNGAVVATENNPYLSEINDNENIILFNTGDTDFPERIKELLADAVSLQRVSDKAVVEAREIHTWQQRAREIHFDLLKML